ncbi:MAG: hypothetical protein COZ98_01210 [Candidatus Omnitrophica bacterium CG_4_8_14_3_um_filter_43_15]|nr:MAG: hypothetical protein COS29_03325 [Candidatus Omnitrophica bacterium CG02_land_8_20_14_3_00__42_8]PIW80651.1 MAG: hypothetical protein COZ98_01210 [Candidatus Omnitrophica bacterium CG_4_8_14_3_um_filter_43_15]
MLKMKSAGFSSVIFFVILAGFIALFFYLNQYSVNQQFIFSKPNEQILGTNFGKLIAGDILKYKKYVYTFMDGMKPIFYPLWGYPLLTLLGIKFGNYSMFLYILQALMALHGVYLFYKIFDIKKKIYHIFLFIPFIGILSVKWPDGITCYLGLLSFYFFKVGFSIKKIKYFVLAGFVLGIMANFRSEYFFLPVFMLAVFIVLRRKIHVPAKFIFISMLSVFAMQLVLLGPWAARSAMFDGKLRFTAANGGGTLYDSLGELPGNPWGLDGDDTDAYKFAQTHDKEGNPVPLQKISPKDRDYYPIYSYSGMQHKINFYPFGHEGDEVLKRQAAMLVKQHPFYFAKKVMHHFLCIFTGGVYIIETEGFGVTTQKHLESLKYFRDLSKKDKILFLSGVLRYKQNLRIAAPYILNWAFRLIFMALFVFFIISARNIRALPWIFYILLPVIAYKVLLVSFIQYSPRHLNFIYMFLLGYFLFRKDAKNANS